MTDTYVPSEGWGSFNDEYREQEYLRAHEVATRIQSVTQAAPYLANDPEVLTTLAQMPVPTDQLHYLAGSVSAQMRLDGTRADLERMEPGRARRVWSQLTPSQQEALRQSGYQPHSEDQRGSNALLSLAGDVIGTGMRGLNYAVTQAPIVSDVFDLMLLLENIPKTMYRGIRLDDHAGLATAAAVIGGLAAAPLTGGLSLGWSVAAVGGAGLLSGTTVAALTNPSAYIDTLHDSWNGEAVFSQGSQQKARDLLQNGGVDVLARDIAWEMDTWETVKLFASTPDATSDMAYFASMERVLDRIADPGDPRREQLAAKLQELMRHEDFREAVEVLQHSKVSFGRDIARLLNVEPGTTAHTLVSGSMDALFTLGLDPTLAAGGAAKWHRARRLGVPFVAGSDTFEAINAISKRANEVPTIGAAYDEIAHAVNTNQPHLLWRRVPTSKGLFDDLWNYKRLMEETGMRSRTLPADEATSVFAVSSSGETLQTTSRVVDEAYDGVFTRDDIFDWMHQGTNFERMLAGHGVKQGYGRLMLPTYGWKVPFIEDPVKVGKPIEGLKAFIDFADDAGNRAHMRKIARELAERGETQSQKIGVADNLAGAFNAAPVPDEEWQNLRALVDAIDRFPVLNKMLRATGQLGASFTEMMPATNSISMVGPKAAEDIQRFVGLGRTVGMTSMERKAWFDTIMQQDNIEHRMNASLSFLDTMLNAGGVRSTERGTKLADQFINKVKHRYSLGNSDQYLMGERVVPRGIHPYQHTFDLPIPDLKVLRQYAEKGLLLKFVYRATDLEFVDAAVNKIWKPAVLLRVGFITRAAGEELLAHLARAGPSTLLNEFGARSIAEGRLHADAKRAALAMEKLTPQQVKALERMRYAAHVRPLERMFSNWEMTSPLNDVLASYTDWTRAALERGLFKSAPRFAPRRIELGSSWASKSLVREAENVALLGKSNGFRRSLLLGVDPNLIRYAEAFGRQHGTTLMREVSSHNANIWSGDTIADKADFRHRYTDETGELQELGFMVERGNFRVYRKGDKMFDRAAHGGVAKIVNDPVTGPVYVNVTTRYVPDSLSDDVVYGFLGSYRQIEDWRIKTVLDELLSHTDARTTNWESMLRSISRSEPELGDLLRAAHRSMDETPAQARQALDTLRTWVRQKYRAGGGLTEYGGKALEQITVAERLLDGLDAFDEAAGTLTKVGKISKERAWTAAFLDQWGRVDELPELIRGFDNYRAELAARLRDRHYDLEVQPLVNGLTYTNRLADGTPVAHPPRENRSRLWIPQVTPETYGRMLSHLRAYGGRGFTERMMAMWADAQPHLAGLHISQADEILERFLNRIALSDPVVLARHASDVSAAGTHGNLIPIALMGFDDPDVALRFSQFMNGTLSRNGTELSMAGRMRDNKGYVALLDMDDSLRHMNPMDVDGAHRPIAHDQWQTNVTVGTVEHVDMVRETVDVPLKPDTPAPPLPERFSVTLDDDHFDLASGRPTETFYERTQELIDRLDPNTTEIHFVAGGREYADVDAMRVHLTRVAQDAAARGKHVVLVEGGARGADSLAGRVGRELNMNVIEFPANWRPDGNLRMRAGYERNEVMADFLQRFRRGRSTGYPTIPTDEPRVAMHISGTNPDNLREIEYIDQDGIAIFNRNVPDDVDAVRVDRSSPFGNPFRIRDGDRNAAVQRYAEWISQPEQAALRARMRRELAGHALVCHCAPLPCHAQIIAKIVNSADDAALFGAVSTRPFRVTAATFPGGKGTDNMRELLRKQEIPSFAPANEIVQPDEVVVPRVRQEEVRTTERVTPRKAQERTLHSWALDQEYVTPRTVSVADQELITLPDGSRHFGAHPQDAIADGVEKMVDDWIAHISPGAQQRRRVVGEVYDRTGQPIPVGSELHFREDAFDSKGVDLEWDDPRFELLEPTLDTHVQENMSMLAPLLRDGTDNFNDTARMVSDHRDLRGLTPAQRKQRSQLAPLDGREPGAREFRGHWSHVNDLDNPPLAAVGPAIVPIDAPSRWDKVLEFGFEKMISPAIDAIIRRPLAFHMFAEAMAENERALRWGLSTHLFGDELTGQVGELAKRFGHILDDPAMAVASEDIAEEILGMTRVLMPDDYVELAQLPPDQIVNGFLGRFGDDTIFAGTIEQQARAATNTMRLQREHVILDRIANAPATSSVKRTIKAIQDQTEVPLVRLMGIAADPAVPFQSVKWVPFDASQAQRRMYVTDVPAAEASSSIRRLDAQTRGVFDPDEIPGLVSTEFRQLDKVRPRRLSDDDVVAGMREWMRTGKRPKGWENVSDVAHQKMAKNLRDLADDTNQFEMLNGYSFGEWQEAIDSAHQLAQRERWTLPIRNNERPIEGVLDAYIEQLDDVLDRSWAEAQRRIGELPPPLRDALDEQSWAVLSAAYRNKKKLGDTIEALAAERAIRNSMPYLDSHEIRSQAGEYVRGFFPFMYAEENFIKRWARTLKVAPDALRKGQLVYMGLKSGGVIRTDSQGRDWFVYPGVGIVSEQVNRTLSAVGWGEVMPSGAVFASQPKNMLPGFDVERTGMSSANPLVALPVGAVANIFPELRPVQEALVGEIGVAQGGVNAFVPSSIRRFWDVIGDEEATVRYASAMMSAIAVLEHNGHGLPEGATANQLDDYIRRVRNHTRGILATQAFVGFIAPGAPTVQFTGESQLSVGNLTGLSAEIPADIFRQEYLTLVRELGIEEGTIAYFENNPDHDVYDLMPFTVGQSRSSSGAPIPVTHDAVRFADENPGFIEDYPMASAWLLPQPDPGEDDYDSYAYVQQAISGLRQRRSPTEFMEALKYREGAHEYFRAREEHEANMLAAEGDPLKRKQLTDIWDTYKARHLAMHPVFAEQLEGGESRQRRKRVMDELRTAVFDPATPQVAHLAAVRDLVESFDLYKITVESLSHSRAAEDVERLARYKALFEDNVALFLERHPELEPLWMTVFKPEASL